MKNLFLTTTIILSAWFVLSGCESNNSSNNPIGTQYKQNSSQELGNKSLDKLTQATLNELARAKSVTAQYHNINKAISDGYVDIKYFVHQMGWHFLKIENLDGTFEVDKPELLVYAPNKNGKYQLVAIEYATPWTEGSTPPEGFTGDQDVWSHFIGDPSTTDDDLWTLHAWVWYHNPDGMFNPYNPRVD